MTHLWLTVLTAAVLAGSMPAYAQGQARPFDRADQNRDGTLTVEEFDLMRERRLGAADTDRNGGVDRQEFLAAARKSAEQRRILIFQRFDTNRDGLIGRDEFTSRARPQGIGRQSAGARRTRQFSWFDLNGDGKISGDEFVMAVSKRAERQRDRVFRRLDTDRDGVISRSEREAGTRVFFLRIDLNGDGKVTREEMRAALSKWRDRRAKQSAEE